MTESQQLLAEYVRTGSESAFRELVNRYIGLVYSAAHRLTNGHTHVAEDIAQTVFADLARIAPKLSGNVLLGGWLHRHTCFVTATFLRGERRRQAREKKAVEVNTMEDYSAANLAALVPILDEAIDELGTTDRTAILLRFFEQRDFRSVGKALGSNEDAARIRVNRALEKLQLLLKKRGIAFSTATLGSVLTSQSLSAAPLGLAAAISTTAITAAHAASRAGVTLNFLKLMASTKLKTAAAGMVVLGAIVAPLLLRQDAQAKLRERDEALRRGANRVAQLQSDNQRLSLAVANASLTAEQLSDLRRLRVEVGALRQKADDTLNLREENRRLQAAMDRPRTVLEVKEEMIFRANYARRLTDALFKFARENQGQFPATMEQAVAFLENNTNTPIVSLEPQHYEIVFHGDPKSLNGDATNIIVLREREAWRTGPLSDPKGRWGKYYGYADGSVRFRPQTENNFEEFEKEHLPPTNQ